MKVSNTEVKFSQSSLFLPAVIIFYSISAHGLSFEGLMKAAITIAILFFIIIFHEFAHVKASEWLGFGGNSKITIWGLGGLAEIPGFPLYKPQDELLVSAAGPVSNFLMAGTVLLLGFLFGKPTGYLGYSYDLLVTYNLFIGLFNLLPAFPMDGGRIVRAVLSMFMMPFKATEISVYIAKAMAILLFGVAIYLKMPILFLITIFIWFTSSAELKNKKDNML